MIICNEEHVDRMTVSHLKQRNNFFALAWLGLFLIIYFIGSYVLFIRNRNRQKPGFVKVIWVLVAIWILAKATGVSIAIVKRGNILDGEIEKGAHWVHYTLTILYYFEMNLVALIHYLFAIQYFELALKFPIIMRLMVVGGSAAKKRAKRIDLIILALNGVFYTTAIVS